jgi:hypothetical protein
MYIFLIIMIILSVLSVQRLHYTIKTIIVVNESSVGGLVGKMSGGRINNSSVSNSYISGGNQRIKKKLGSGLNI